MRLDLRSNLLREGSEFVKSLLPSFGRRQLRRLLGPQRRVIRTIADLDQALFQAEQAFARSDAEGRQALEQFCFAPPFSIPPDPRSAAYWEAQHELYRLISGRPDYAVTNEASPFDLEEAKRVPFPYNTGNPQTVGDQLIAQGFFIKSMNLPPGAKVVEFGAGWGNSTWQLLQMGYRVTAVDADARVIELLQHRCHPFGASFNSVHSDMLKFDSDERFDAALFFESFHHCADHIQMIRHLDELLVAQGLIVFASEPIADFSYPWGIRLDGLSLWSMRKYGWLELGFTPEYFFATLKEFGWIPRWFRSRAISPMTDVITATRSDKNQ